MPSSCRRRGAFCLGLVLWCASAAHAQTTPPTLTPPAPDTAAATNTAATPDSGATTTAPPTVPGGPAVLVPAPTRGGKAQPPLQGLMVAALQKRFGVRVLDPTVVIEAQTRSGITSQDLKPQPTPVDATGPLAPAALARLGAATTAERAILVEIKDSETTALVYKSLDGPALVVALPRKKGDALDQTWADSVAAEVERLAGGALAAEDPKVAPSLARDARAEILAEEAADRRRAQRLAEQRAREQNGEPFAWVLVGGGASQRFLEVGGTGAKALAPLEFGTVPDVSVFAALSPLRAVPSLRGARFLDVFVDLAYRRGFPSVLSSSGKRCPVDDDDVALRGGWQVVPVAHPWVPRVGVTATGAYERVQFGCTLPVVSTHFTSVGGGLRLTQPLLPRADDNTGSPLELDVHGGLRALLLGADEGGVAPGLTAEAYLVARPWRVLALRAGPRLSTASASITDGSEQLLLLDDKRLSFDLQVGVVF